MVAAAPAPPQIAREISDPLPEWVKDAPSGERSPCQPRARAINSTRSIWTPSDSDTHPHSMVTEESTPPRRQTHGMVRRSRVVSNSNPSSVRSIGTRILDRVEDCP